MENTINNQSLVKEQYKNPDNLNARINIYRFNTNKIDWNRWFFEKMDIPEHSNILELGCGNVLLWKSNEESINETLNITLSDFSEGMLQSANQNINNENIKLSIYRTYPMKMKVLILSYQDICCTMFLISIKHFLKLKEC